jgi:hypothetical protein
METWGWAWMTLDLGPGEGLNFAPIGNLLLRHESHMREPVGRRGGVNERDGRNGRKSGIPSYPPRSPPETPAPCFLRRGWVRG